MSLEPKRLHRRLKALLSSLDPRRPLAGIVDKFVDEIFETLSSELHVRTVLLYSERHDGFKLVNQAGEPTPGVRTDISRSDRCLELLTTEKYWLYEENEEKRCSGLPAGPMACIIAGHPSRRLLLFFGLGDGWQRDDVALVLNTVRVALGSRLMYERVSTTFEEAAEIQRSLIPEAPPRFADYDIACRSVAAEEVGGDFYDFIPFDEEIMGVAIGDASGHGLPAALLVHAVVTGLRMGLEKDLKVSHVFKKLNRVIHRSRMTSRFISVFYGELEGNGNLIYVNAGHPPPYLFLADHVARLREGGTIMGPLMEARFKRGFAHVDRGATLVLVSDGILERRDADDGEFGDEALVELVRANPTLTAQELLDLLFRSVRAHGNDGRWEDDATAVIIKRPGRRD